MLAVVEMELEKLKKAILVASFGTSYEETRIKNITAVENEIKDSFKDCAIYTAFTSEMIRKKLAKSGVLIDNVCTALEKMKSENIREVIILPTHLIFGIEYEKVCVAAKKYEHEFDTIKIAKPLLKDTEAVKNILSILVTSINVEEDEAIVLMGHGSEHHANMIYPAMNYIAQEAGFENIFTCTVEGYPEIDSTIKDLNKHGYKKVLLTALMLVAGDHANNDMASDEQDSLKSVLISNGFTVRCLVKGLGEYERIRKMYCENVREQSGN